MSELGAKAMTSGELADATIVFDLDGTLVDTAPDLVRALNQTMDLEGLPRVKLDTVRLLVGQGARVLIERVRGAARRDVHGRAAGRADAGIHRLLPRRHRARVEAVIRHVLDAMDQLAALGAKFAVCTNKRTDLSVQLLEALGHGRALFRDRGRGRGDAEEAASRALSRGGHARGRDGAPIGDDRRHRCRCRRGAGRGRARSLSFVSAIATATAKRSAPTRLSTAIRLWRRSAAAYWRRARNSRSRTRRLRDLHQAATIRVWAAPDRSRSGAWSADH